MSARVLRIDRAAAATEFARAWRFALLGALTNTFVLWFLTERAANRRWTWRVAPVVRG